MNVEQALQVAQIVGITIAALGSFWIGTSHLLASHRKWVLHDHEQRLSRLERELGIDA